MFDKYIMSGRRRMFLKKLIWMQMLGLTGSLLPWQTFTGNPLQFNAPKAHTLKSATVEFSPKQSGTGDPSPDNVRPISGWTGLDVFVRGNNTWDEEWANGYFNTTTGAFTESASNTTLCSKNYIPVKGGTTYCFVQPINQSPQVYQYDKSEGFLKRITGISANNGTFTVDANCAFIKFAVFGYGSGHYDKDVSINYPSTETSYVPYNEDSATYSITWQDEAGTVYGGTIDLTTGVLTATWALDDFGRFTFYAFDANTGLYGSNTTLTNLPCANYSNIYAVGNWLCERYKSETYSHLSDGAKGFAMYRNGNNCYFRLRDDAFIGYAPADVKTALTGVKFGYELATPVTYQLTPTQIDALLGINTMWTDGDSLTVEARGEAVNLNALQSLNMLLGGRYYNNGTADEPTDEEALRILMGGER